MAKGIKKIVKIAGLYKTTMRVCAEQLYEVPPLAGRSPQRLGLRSEAE